MSIRRIEVQRYRVPFRTPFTTSRGRERFRRGLLVRMTTGDGLIGHGEAAALREFGTGSFEEIERDLFALSGHMIGKSLDDAQAQLANMTDSPTNAPARFALDTALLDLQSQQAGTSLARYLDPGAASLVPVNATISEVDAERAASAASYAMLAGFTAVKVKVGVLDDPGEETERIAALREAIGPETELRLDANGAWTLDQARSLASRLSRFDIAYLEQPLPAGDYDNMARLKREISIPVAADEGATSVASIETIVARDAADVLILKPGIVGGLRPAREVMSLAQRAGLKVVVTTALETGVAITAALHLAATLPQPIAACGLATGALLQSDLLVDSPSITDGMMNVPDRPGLGVEPAQAVWSSPVEVA